MYRKYLSPFVMFIMARKGRHHSRAESGNQLLIWSDIVSGHFYIVISTPVSLCGVCVCGVCVCQCVYVSVCVSVCMSVCVCVCM